MPFKGLDLLLALLPELQRSKDCAELGVEVPGHVKTCQTTDASLCAYVKSALFHCSENGKGLGPHWPPLLYPVKNL